LLAISPEIVDHPNAKPLQLNSGTIQLNKVHFSYLPGKVVIDNLSLVVPGGTMLAIVGTSGSGKSTIAKLLLRHYTLQNGQIEIDNQDIANVTRLSLCSACGYVAQETELFNQSIRYNLLLGEEGIGDGQLLEVLSQVNLAE